MKFCIFVEETWSLVTTVNDITVKSEDLLIFLLKMKLNLYNMLIFTFLALYLCMAAIFKTLILRLTSNHISSSGLVHRSQISCSVPCMAVIFLTLYLSKINRLLGGESALGSHISHRTCAWVAIFLQASLCKVAIFLPGNLCVVAIFLQVDLA